MDALRDRHLIGRRGCGQPHSCPRRGGSRAASPASAANGGSGGAGGVGDYMGGIARTSSPPLAMEMALRREHASSFTGNSLPGQRAMTGGSLGEGGELPPRECRAFSTGGQYASDRLDRAAEMMGRRSTLANLYPNHGGGGGGGNSSGGGGAGDEGYSFDDRFGGRQLSNGSHHSSHGGATPKEHRGGSFDNNGRGSPDNSSRQRSFPASSPRTRPLSPPSAPLNPLVDPTILRHLIPFAAEDGFLFVAGVSRSWRDAWGVERPPETEVDAAVQSPSRLGWARASGLVWGPSVCARAASGGHLATLRYARALGCPWDWTCCALATTQVRLVSCVFLLFISIDRAT